MKKMGCLHWLALGVSQQWSGVDTALCWWEIRVLTSGGDGPAAAAGPQRLHPAGRARAQLVGTVAGGSLWSGMESRGELESTHE